MPERSRVMTQTKRDTPVLQVEGLTSSPRKNNVVMKPKKKIQRSPRPTQSCRADDEYSVHHIFKSTAH
jgi:hypothetical protein